MNKRQKEIRAQELEDIKWVMSTEQGRRFVSRLLAEGNLLGGDLMTGNSWTFFNIGANNQARFVWSEINEADMESVFQMLREQQNPQPEENEGEESDA